MIEAAAMRRKNALADQGIAPLRETSGVDLWERVTGIDPVTCGQVSENMEGELGLEQALF